MLNEGTLNADMVRIDADAGGRPLCGGEASAAIRHEQRRSPLRERDDSSTWWVWAPQQARRHIATILQQGGKRGSLPGRQSEGNGHCSFLRREALRREDNTNRRPVGPYK